MRAGILLLSVSMLAPAGATQIDASPIDLLEYYNLGEHEPVRSALTRAAGGDLGIILDAWKVDAEKWIEADGAVSSARRRLVVATLALEVGRAALDNQWQRSRELIEWTCALWRKQRTRTAGERLFHLGAIALIEGARDVEALDEHAAHVKDPVSGRTASADGARVPAGDRILGPAFESRPQ